MSAFPLNLQSRRLVVTGGLGVLGRAVVAALVARGARVAVLDRVSVEAPLEGVAVCLAADLGEVAAADQAMARVAQVLGGLDGLVNVAGGFRWETVAQGSLDTWDLLYATNLRSCVSACRAALPHLREAGQGRIVNIGAAGALKAGLGMGAYAASKAGVARLTEALAEELKDQNITVNAVLPSIIDTPANRADMPDADATRWVTPQALAQVIAFLVSDEAAPITGACLPVTGRV